MPTLATLDRRFRPYAESFFRWSRDLGAPVVVTSARRTWQEQAHLWSLYVKRGRTGLTALPPGRSQHQRGLAWDMATPGVDPKADPWLARLGPLWRSMGGVWGGEADPVHFEAPKAWTGRDGRKARQHLAGYR